VKSDRVTHDFTEPINKTKKMSKEPSKSETKKQEVEVKQQAQPMSLIQKFNSHLDSYKASILPDLL